MFFVLLFLWWDVVEWHIWSVIPGAQGVLILNRKKVNNGLGWVVLEFHVGLLSLVILKVEPEKGNACVFLANC